MSIRNSLVFALMEIEVIKSGCPKHYQDDFFKHDRATVKTMGDNETWYWGIRECGTQLYQNWSDMRSALKAFDDFVALFKIQTGDGCIFDPTVSRIPYLHFD